MTQLPKVITIKRKRLGRGIGSGKGGHTSSRGQKGQKSRRKIGVLFEGMKMKKSLIKRLPLMRGKGKFKAYGKPMIVNAKALESLPEGTEITLELLIKKGIVNEKSAKKFGVKVLGIGKNPKKFTFKVAVSGKINA